MRQQYLVTLDQADYSASGGAKHIADLLEQHRRDMTEMDADPVYVLVSVATVETWITVEDDE